MKTSEIKAFLYCTDFLDPFSDKVSLNVTLGCYYCKTANSHCLLQVRYISNFFKVRTFPQCPSPETAENEERKPSLHLSEVEHNNHLGYSGPV